jgi:hypothetical protein
MSSDEVIQVYPVTPVVKGFVVKLATIPTRTAKPQLDPAAPPA